MLRLGWVVVIASALGSVAGRAEACDCLQAEPAPREALGRAAAVFEGRALARQGDRTELLVERAWKGAVAGARVLVASDGSSCGYRWLPGDRVLIYAPRVAGTLHVAQCDGATRVVMGDAIDADRAILGPPSSAIATAATVAPASPCACTGLALAAPAADTVEALDARVLRSRVSAGRRQIDVERTSRRPRARPRAWTLHTPADACGVDLAPGARVRIRGVTQWPGALAVGVCAGGSSVQVLSR